MPLNTSNMGEKMRAGIINRMNKKAIEDVNRLRRRLSTLQLSTDFAQKKEVTEQFMRAADIQQSLHQKVRNVPKDKVILVETGSLDKKQKRKPICHSHFVKMSLDQMPSGLREKVLSQSHHSSQNFQAHTRTTSHLQMKSQLRRSRMIPKMNSDVMALVPDQN